MLLELFFSRLALQGLVAVAPGHGHTHDLAVQLEAVHLLDGIQACLLAVEHDKRLPLPFQAVLNDDVEDGAIVLEDGGQSCLHLLILDPLLEVIDLHLLARARAMGYLWVAGRYVRRYCGRGTC